MSSDKQTNHIPFENETIFTDFGCKEENERQAKLVTYPTGFYLVETLVGDKMGYGFYCPRCKLHVPANAPRAVKHCGTVSRQPELPDGLFKWLKFFFNVKTVKLQPRRYF